MTRSMSLPAWSARRFLVGALCVVVVSTALATPVSAGKPQPPPPPPTTFETGPSPWLPSDADVCNFSKTDPTYVYTPGSGRKKDPERVQREQLAQLDFTTIGGSAFPTTFKLYYAYFDCASKNFAAAWALTNGQDSDYGEVPDGCVIVGSNQTEVDKGAKGKKTKFIVETPQLATLAHELAHCWQYMLWHLTGDVPATKASEDWLYKGWIDEGFAEWVALALTEPAVPRADWVFYDAWRKHAVSESAFQEKCDPCTAFDTAGPYPVAGLWLNLAERHGDSKVVEAYETAYKALPLQFVGGGPWQAQAPSAWFLEQVNNLGATPIEKMGLPLAVARTVGKDVPAGYSHFGAGYTWPDQENFAGGSTTSPDPKLTAVTTWGDLTRKSITIPPGEVEVYRLGGPTTPIWEVEITTSQPDTEAATILIRDADLVDAGFVTPTASFRRLFGEDGATCPNGWSAEEFPISSPASAVDPDFLIIGNQGADPITVEVRWRTVALQEWRNAECDPLWTRTDQYARAGLSLGPQGSGFPVRHDQYALFNTTPNGCFIHREISQSIYTTPTSQTDAVPCYASRGVGVDWTLGGFHSFTVAGFDRDEGRHAHHIDWQHNDLSVPGGWNASSVVISEYEAGPDAKSITFRIPSCPPATFDSKWMYWIDVDGDRYLDSGGFISCNQIETTIDVHPTSSVEVYVNSAVSGNVSSGDSVDTTWDVFVELH